MASVTDANPYGEASDVSAKIDWDTPSNERDAIIERVIGTGGKPIFRVRGSNFYADEGGYAVSVEITSVGSKDPVEVTSIFTVGDPPLSAVAAPLLADETFAPVEMAFGGPHRRARPFPGARGRVRSGRQPLRRFVRWVLYAGGTGAFLDAFAPGGSPGIEAALGIAVDDLGQAWRKRFLCDLAREANERNPNASLRVPLPTACR